jgi:iron complex transport system ATP-binding protein
MNTSAAPGGGVASPLLAHGVSIGYPGRTVVSELDIEILGGEFTVIVGPNACGKSTLLRALGRLLQPTEGRVLLDGEAIASYSTKEVARRVGLLPQSPITPDAITVADLVARGRYPYQSILRQWSVEDATAVEDALEQVGMREHAERMVDELSGGQRQRVWIAMSLAQQTPTLLLDEPTTYLDVAHQIDVLDLCSQLHEEGRTLVAVLMSEGSILAEGAAEDVLTTELLEHAFGLRARVIEDPENGRPMVVPLDRRRRKVRTEGAA